MAKFKTIKVIGAEIRIYPERTENAHGAPFYKDVDSAEGYYHICDGHRSEYIPEMWTHDCNTILYFEKKIVASIDFCPICGAEL